MCMGKKKKKSFYKKQLKPFLKGNKILLAALAGAATGITLASILGTEKAQQVVHGVENSVRDFKDRVNSALTHDNREPEPARDKRTKNIPVPIT